VITAKIGCGTASDPNRCDIAGASVLASPHLVFVGGTNIRRGEHSAAVLTRLFDLPTELRRTCGGTLWGKSRTNDARFSRRPESTQGTRWLTAMAGCKRCRFGIGGSRRPRAPSGWGNASMLCGCAGFAIRPQMLACLRDRPAFWLAKRNGCGDPCGGGTCAPMADNLNARCFGGIPISRACHDARPMGLPFGHKITRLRHFTVSRCRRTRAANNYGRFRVQVLCLMARTRVLEAPLISVPSPLSGNFINSSPTPLCCLL